MSVVNRSEQKIRRASATDAERLAQLHHETVEVAYRAIFEPDSKPPSVQSLTTDWQRLLAREDAEVFLVTHGSDAVGSVAVVPDAGAPSGLLLKRLHVHPTKWGRSLGSQLHDFA